MSEAGYTLDSRYLNLMCEITRDNNAVLHYGRIRSIDGSAIDVYSFREGMVFDMQLVGTQVKVNIYSPQAGFKVLAGQVAECSGNYMRIGGLELLAVEDKRGFLRIKVNIGAHAQLRMRGAKTSRDLQLEGLVRMLDISVGGVLITTILEFEVGDILHISFELLGYELDLDCKVLRKEHREGEASPFYGLNFYNISDRLQSTMNKLLLELQQQRIAARRNSRGRV